MQSAPEIARPEPPKPIPKRQGKIFPSAQRDPMQSAPEIAQPRLSQIDSQTARQYFHSAAKGTDAIRAGKRPAGTSQPDFQNGKAKFFPVPKGPRCNLHRKMPGRGSPKPVPKQQGNILPSAAKGPDAIRTGNCPAEALPNRFQNGTAKFSQCRKGTRCNPHRKTSGLGPKNRFPKRHGKIFTAPQREPMHSAPENVQPRLS